MTEKFRETVGPLERQMEEKIFSVIIGNAWSQVSVCTSMVREGVGRSNIREATDQGLLREGRCSVKRCASRLCNSETTALLTCEALWWLEEVSRDGIWPNVKARKDLVNDCGW